MRGFSVLRHLNWEGESVLGEWRAVLGVFCVVKLVALCWTGSLS